MLGDAFGRIVHDTFPLWTAAPAAYGLVAMAAFFAAAAEAPITAIFTGGMVDPCGIANACAAKSNIAFYAYSLLTEMFMPSLTHYRF